ncbi:MAG: divalent-cation tolerance protein CutA [Planctomycetes bacterium]|nr:divalent-cation tolerance protein CutA [Planctomycetota bacterium]
MTAVDEVRMVYLTAPDEACAAAIARTLVDERLAACVNILPGMRAIYRWEGAIEDVREVVLIAKTVPAQVMGLSARVRALHPYALPCILVLGVDGGFPPYLAWLAKESRPAP